MNFRRKFIACGLALGLVISGASISSASVDGTQAQEGNLEVTKINKSEEIQPMFWAWAAQSVGKQVGKYATRFLLGNNALDDNDYNYGQIKKAFDF